MNQRMENDENLVIIGSRNLQSRLKYDHEKLKMIW